MWEHRNKDKVYTDWLRLHDCIGVVITDGKIDNVNVLILPYRAVTPDCKHIPRDLVHTSPNQCNLDECKA